MTAEEKVRAKFPDATCDWDYGGNARRITWYIWKNKIARPIGIGESLQDAWADAARNIEAER